MRPRGRRPRPPGRAARAPPRPGPSTAHTPSAQRQPSAPGGRGDRRGGDRRDGAADRHRRAVGADQQARPAGEVPLHQARQQHVAQRAADHGQRGAGQEEPEGAGDGAQHQPGGHGQRGAGQHVRVAEAGRQRRAGEPDGGEADHRHRRDQAGQPAGETQPLLDLLEHRADAVDRRPQVQPGEDDRDRRSAAGPRRPGRGAWLGGAVTLGMVLRAGRRSTARAHVSARRSDAAVSGRHRAARHTAPLQQRASPWQRR